MDTQRDNVIKKNIVINYIGKLFYYILSFSAVPLSIEYMGKERFGVFQTILTFLSWAAIANLGIGNGLRNKVSEYIGLKKTDEIKSVIGSSFIIAMLISSILLIIGIPFFYLCFNPSWLISNSSLTNGELRLTFSVAFVFFCFNLFFNLFSSLAYGIHKSYLVTISQSFQYGLYCFFLFLCIKLNINSYLVYVSILYGISMIFCQIIPFIWIVKDRVLWPPNFNFDRKYYKELLNISLSFFLLQLSSIVLFTSDNFIISKLLGPDEVAEYSIANKVFFFIINLFSILLIQVWNSTTDAITKKDYNWIKRMNMNLHKLLIYVLFLSLAVAVCLNWIVKLWIGESYNYSLSFVLIFALYVLIHCSNAIYVNFLNGIGRLKRQTFSYILGAIINVILAYFFIVKLNTGMIGVLYSKIICVSFTSLICMYDYRQFIKSI